MATENIYDFSMDDSFSEKFKKYVRKKNLLCQKLSTALSGEESSPKAKGKWYKRVLRKKQQSFAEPKCIWVFRKLQQVDGEDSAYNALIDKMVRVLGAFDACGEYVIKFWEAEEVNRLDDVGQRQILLTTRGRPFLVAVSGSQLSFRICSYLMRIAYLDSKDEGVGEGGMIGRVFRNKRMELTPDVGYYSNEEYPHRDLALSCQIKFSLALPLFDSSGVIELVSTLDPRKSFARLFQGKPESSITKLCRMFQRECLDCCKCQFGSGPSGGDFLHNVAEIKDIMKVVGKRCDVVLGQTWILCELCNSLSTSERFGKTLDASYRPYLGKNCCFLDVESMFNLQMEEGVVGKAASSPHNVVYCEDVSKFNITEYPLAHFAQLFDLSGCFAICLRSSHLTGGQVYVLEFFTRYQSGYVGDSNLSVKLVPVIEAMRQNFRTFSFYREELEGRFSIQVIRMNDVEAGRQYLLEGSIGKILKDITDEGGCSKDNSSSTVESELRMPIKAYYGDGFIAFLLSDTSIDALREQVSQGLNLENGTYIIKYRDVENDWIRIECDQDVNEYVKHSTSLGVYMLSIELKNSSQYQCFSIF